MGTSYHTKPIVTDGLVLCLDALNPDSYPGSGTDWNSLVGNISGSLINGPTFDGKSIVFDGVNDYVKTNYGAGLNIYNNPISTFVWAKANSFSDQSQFVFSTGQDRGIANSSMRYYAGIRDSTWDFGILNSPWTDPSRIISASLDWFNMGLVVDTISSRLYINGELLYTKSTDVNYVLNDSIWIGTHNGLGNYFDGQVSQVLIYSKSLTQQEIQQNYNALKRRYGI